MKKLRGRCFRVRPSTKKFHFFVPLALLFSFHAYAEQMLFSYTFSSNPGVRLFGQIDGTISSIDSNRVTINSFGTVSLSRSGFERFDFPSIEVTEFNGWAANRSPVMTFNGTEINFRVCPSGFTSPDGFTGIPFQDCPFASEGGFLVATERPANPAKVLATVADPSFGRITDGALLGAWNLTLVPDGIDPTVIIDPSVTVGANTTVNAGVILEENVELGNNVDVNKNTSIGSNSTVANNVVLNKDGDVGSDVTIGENVTIAQGVIIEGGVVIEDGAFINRGAYICASVTIGSMAIVGKNNLVTENVPLSGELPGSNTPPNGSNCPE
jgi:carbonic anhydrase/acetyltransferase-like protein (isoleucine patch superfamily)